MGISQGKQSRLHKKYKFLNSIKHYKYSLQTIIQGKYYLLQVEQ